MFACQALAEEFTIQFINPHFTCPLSSLRVVLEAKNPSLRLFVPVTLMSGLQLVFLIVLRTLLLRHSDSILVDR